MQQIVMLSHPGDQGSNLQVHPEWCQLQCWGDEEGCGETVSGPIPPQGGRQWPIFPGRLPHLPVQVSLIQTFPTFMASPLRYIRQCIAKADTPHLMLMSKERVYSSLPHNDFHMPGKRNSSWKFSHHIAIFFSLHEEGGHQSKLVL